MIGDSTDFLVPQVQALHGEAGGRGLYLGDEEVGGVAGVVLLAAEALPVVPEEAVRHGEPEDVQVEVVHDRRPDLRPVHQGLGPLGPRLQPHLERVVGETLLPVGMTGTVPPMGRLTPSPFMGQGRQLVK